MKKIYILAIIAFSALAEDKAPLPIPVERQEAISRQMIALLQAQISLLQAKAAADETEAKYNAARAADRKEFHAEGCELPVDKKWVCPPPPKP